MDDGVEGSEVVELFGEAERLVAFGEVADLQAGGVACQAGDVRGLFAVAGVEDDVVAVFDHGSGGTEPEAGGGAGDKDPRHGDRCVSGV